MMSSKEYSAPAIVLGANGTGLATARCLSDNGVDVHMASLYMDDIGRYSHCARIIRLDHLHDGETGICQWLEEYARQLGNNPVVFPTGDQLALVLASNRNLLDPVCRTWSTDFDDLSAIISKEQLYKTAGQAGILTPRMLVEPDERELMSWCTVNPPPYFVKPYYNGIVSSPLKEKNIIFDSVEMLQAYVRSNGSSSLIIQQYIGEGDGSLFDCYGLCLADGSLHSMASHKRIRHYPPGRGATSYGEIPGFQAREDEEILFESTRKLLSTSRYHGIFGIEWMHSDRNNSYYLIDFNARPFSSIGHLGDCGLNLPWLAYLELAGEPPADTPVYPVLKHKYWIDLLNDSRSFVELKKQGNLGWLTWFGEIMRSRSSAYWRFLDPLPALMRLVEGLQITRDHLKKILKP